MTKPARTMIALLLLASCAAAVVYLGVRTVQIGKVRRQIEAATTPDARRTTSDSIELLKRRFPADADVSSFVEHLYAAAEARHLSGVEITTALDPGKTVRKPAAARAVPNAPSVHSLKIAVEGRYRDIASFVQDIQNMERYNRIVSLEMKSGASISADMIVEIVTFGEKDAA